MKYLIPLDTVALSAMTDPLPLRVFRMNDCEWWLATTLEQAKADYMKTVGPMPEEDAFDEPHELSDDELLKLHFVDMDDGERAIGKSRRTFREELSLQRAADPVTPRLFACTEY